jgi:hypothetical protein
MWSRWCAAVVLGAGLLGREALAQPPPQTSTDEAASVAYSNPARSVGEDGQSQNVFYEHDAYFSASLTLSLDRLSRRFASPQ